MTCRGIKEEEGKEMKIRYFTEIGRDNITVCGNKKGATTPLDQAYRICLRYAGISEKKEIARMKRDIRAELS